MARYKALQGIDYPPNKRVEAGKIVEDLPPTSIAWLLQSGVIEDADKPTKIVAEPIVETPQAPIVQDDFDADAIDADGDGFVQDGTTHQRLVEEK